VWLGSKIYKKIQVRIGPYILDVRKVNEERLAKAFKWLCRLAHIKILEESLNRTPDFIVEVEGKIVRVELEVQSSGFIFHKHKPEQVDCVVCLLNNRKLPVKTIELLNIEILKSGKPIAPWFRKQLLSALDYL